MKPFLIKDIDYILDEFGKLEYYTYNGITKIQQKMKNTEG